MKEFTVYPKKTVSPKLQLPELLLMLKEDGSFQQCDEETDVSIEFEKKKYLAKGTWDYVDGNLMLAADRPEKYVGDGPVDSAKTTKSDTLLQGRLIAKKSVKSLQVPKGSIKVGKFFYPKQHPSFFEQPMFQPVKRGSFALKQVIANLQQEERDEIIEKYQRSYFYNKTFLLTTHPIPQRNPKSTTKPPLFKKKTPPPESRPANIRVVEVIFFANNTFSTTAGLGGETILRGKFDVIGRQRDHLWMQVLRFGFGRSVSGSVYSEGRSLSHEDAKAYWGTINGTEVSGSVLDGWGLEPIPVARFFMRETNETEAMLLEEEEEEEEIDEDLVLDETLNIRHDMNDDGVDLSSDDSFQ